MGQILELDKPIDWHTHLRWDERTKIVLPHSARVFSAVEVMPNAKDPDTGKMVVDSKTVAKYKKYLQSVLAETMGSDYEFEFIMSLYLTDKTDIQDLKSGYRDGLFKAVKMYPLGATTGSDAGISEVKNVAHVLEVMSELGIPLLIHPEMSPSKEMNILESESIFVNSTLSWIRKNFSNLKIVVEHVTTKESLKFVLENSNTWGTITPQHLLFNHNAIFEGGLQPDMYCLPLLKQIEHQKYLNDNLFKAIVLDKLALGTDTAPHMSKDKYKPCGCAGVFSAPVALEAYYQAFKNNLGNDNELIKVAMQRFAHILLPVYGINLEDLPKRDISLLKSSWQVPKEYEGITPMFAGQTLEVKALNE
jgi:dihydroorotase